MALIDPANITELTDRLGASELDLATARDIDTSDSAMERLAAARDYVYDLGSALNGDDFDNILNLATSMRSSEKTLTTYLEDTLSEAVSALDTYFIAVVGTGMRAYYTGLDAATTVAWDSDFRNLWRRLQDEELIVFLSSATRSGGVWTIAYDANGIELESTLEVRPETLIGAADVIVTLVLANADGTTSTIGVRVPAATAADTAFPVSNSTYSQFVGINSMSVTGGTNGDIVKLWLSV